MEASDTDNSAKQFQLARNEAQDTPEKGGKEILTYQSSWMIVFLSEYLFTKESISSRNVRSEEVIVFMRFPHLAKQIFEKLNNKSLVKCRQVNEFWKMAVDYEKIILIRKKTVLIRQIRNKIRLSTCAIGKVLQKQDLNTLSSVANYCVLTPDYHFWNPLYVLDHNYSDGKTKVGRHFLRKLFYELESTNSECPRCDWNSSRRKKIPEYLSFRHFYQS